MQTVIVVNGERDWQNYLPGLEVRRVRLQESQWLYLDGKLWVFDGQSSRVDAVLWRLGAVRPHPNHRAVLEMLRMSGVLCVNPAKTLLRGYDRLSMLNELKEAGLPVVSCTVAVGERVLERLTPELPAVLKVGNYHGGFGKALSHDEAHWADLRDLAFTSEDYATIEPYIPYVRDIRCLAIGEEIWAMSRRGSLWRANTQTTHHEIIAVPWLLAEHTRRAMKHLEADILGLDFLERQDGSFVLLESNDIPGLDGFPDEVRTSLARHLRARLTS